MKTTLKMTVWATLMAVGLSSWGFGGALVGGMRAGKRGACETNLKAIGDLITVYTVTEGNALPEQNNHAGLAEFGGGFSQCSSHRTPTAKEAEDPDEARSSYIYLGGFDLDRLADPADTPLVFDKPGNKHVNVLFADMHVEAFKQDDLESCTEIIDFLHKEKKFDDKLYRELLEKAKAVDVELGYAEAEAEEAAA